MNGICLIFLVNCFEVIFSQSLQASIFKIKNLKMLVLNIFVTSFFWERSEQLSAFHSEKSLFLIFIQNLSFISVFRFHFTNNLNHKITISLKQNLFLFKTLRRKQIKIKIEISWLYIFRDL